MSVNIKRVYGPPDKDDGYRVLVDRLWPRGLTKEKAQINEWAKDIAPTNELRKWFHQNETQWDEFQKKYIAYLSENKEKVEPLVLKARKEKLTLLYASKKLQLNNASVLKEYIESQMKNDG